MAVGLFIIAGLAGLLMLAVNVSGLTDIYSGDEGYEISAEFTNVGGLKSRARVTVAGVPVGRVTNIFFDQENYLAKVTMLINKEYSNLPDDTRASILTAGLLGDNYIGLTPGFSEVFLAPGNHILLENTSSAVILEELISKFVAGQASQ